jgi:hypothetical protein
MPIKIQDACAVLPAHKHFILPKKAKYIVAILLRNDLRLVLHVCGARVAAVVLLDRRSTVLCGVLYCRVTLRTQP